MNNYFLITILLLELKQCQLYELHHLKPLHQQLLLVNY